MALLTVFLAATGFLGFMIFIVLGIVATIKKNGKSKSNLHQKVSSSSTAYAKEAIERMKNELLKFSKANI